MGLPRPFSDEQLKLLGENLALSPKHLVHSEVLHSRRGKATDKGLLIFSVCPFSLLIAKTASIAGCDLQFQFMNRDVQCHLCDHTGHSSEHCYQDYESGLRPIYFDDNGIPSFTPPTSTAAKQSDKEKNKEEKSEDEGSKVKSKDPPKEQADVDSRPSSKGKGRNR